MEEKSSASEPDMQDAIRPERMRSVFDQMPVTLGSALINAALTVAVLYPVAPHSWLLAWLILVVAVSAARAFGWGVWGRDWAARRVLPALAVGGAACSGLLWGLGTVTLFPPSGAHQLFLSFVIGGMCAGATTLNSAHFPTVAAFILPASLPLALRLASAGSMLLAAASAMLIVFAATLLLASWRFHRHFGETFRLQFELSKRTRELDESNARLRAEIAEHQSTERVLRQVQKMEAVGQLTGGIAHDFNNLLTAIIGNLELIIASRDNAEAVRRFAAAAERAATRGANLVSSLLAFARRQTMKVEPVHVNGLLREFLPLLQRAVGDMVRLEMDLQPELPDCLADAAHFQSSVLNLAINARDAMPNGGTLSVTTRVVDLEPAALAHNPDAKPGRFVAVSARDTGTGMSTEVAEKAFEPFFTTKEAGKGSGLGLSQVYGFARQSGGHITIETGPGRGTTVRLFLPVQGIAALSQAKPDIETGRGTPASYGTVLVVEDDAEVLEVVRATLSEAGFEVITAGSGAAALPVLESDRQIGILFTDVVMPDGISGVDLARRARKLRPGLPVLLTSGYAPGTVLAKGVVEGEFELLPKPFHREDLAARLRAALRRADARV
jgi:signal transduction histidine kinase/ActR/RegA family two-component response regulator